MKTPFVLVIIFLVSFAHAESDVIMATSDDIAEFDKILEKQPLPPQRQPPSIPEQAKQGEGKRVRDPRNMRARFNERLPGMRGPQPPQRLEPPPLPPPDDREHLRQLPPPEKLPPPPPPGP